MRNTFIGYVIHETPKAFLFQDHFWEEPEWMPKSQMVVVSDFDSTEIVCLASQWISKQKDIVEFTHREKKDEPNED